MSTQKPTLDHIIILIPYSTLLSLPTTLTKEFTVSPGGTHAGGLTANKLITFSDGVYLELISFVPAEGEKEGEEKSREGHWWGQKKYGIIDWALSTAPPSTAKENWERLNKLAKEGRIAAYEKPVKGGRILEGGKEIAWEVTFPRFSEGKGEERGERPFWCHDITPRSLRVPGAKENITHPNGVKGVKGLTVFVERGGVEEKKKELEGIIGERVLEGGQDIRAEEWEGKGLGELRVWGEEGERGVDLLGLLGLGEVVGS